MLIPSLDIIIVNWNAGWQLRECLESIGAAQRDGFELRRVIVVDNASSDGSADRLEDLNLPLTILRNIENRGFAAACNQGASGSDADYLLFLNPDTRLFNDSLLKPVRFMQQPENAAVGICGIQLIDELGKVTPTCSRFPAAQEIFYRMLGLDRLFPQLFPPHFMTEWDHQDTRAVDQVMGAFFLIRRSLFESLGGFDERFFVYYEEVDLSYRARQSGWSSYYLAGAQAFHKGGGTSDQVKAARLFYSLRSRIQFGYKHWGWLVATAHALGTLSVELIARLAMEAARASGKGTVETLKGYQKLWRQAPKLLMQRGRKQA